MARTTRASRAADAYAAARSHPYVQRVIEDDELRHNLRDAYDAARGAYGRISRNGKSPAKQVMSDKKVQRDLRAAADSLREASEQLRAPKRRKSRLGRLLLLGAVGAVVTLAVSESARKALMDALFGAEEEFEYTSTTSAESSDGAGS
jgi:CHASE1-domain containing sensor protein